MLFAGCLRAQLLSASKRGFLLGLRHKTHATSVYKEEARKLLLLNGAALVLAAFAGFGIYQGVTAESYIGPDEIYYAYYMKHTSGPFTQESYDWLEEQGEEFAPMLEVQRKVAAGELSSDAMLAFSSLQQKYSVYSRVINQNINYYLKEHPGAWLVYESGYKELFGFTGDADVQDTLLAGLACALCFSGLFSMERRGGMETILCTTPLGRKRTVRAKLAVSAGVAVLIAAAVLVSGSAITAAAATGGFSQLMQLVFGKDVSYPSTLEDLYTVPEVEVTDTCDGIDCQVLGVFGDACSVNVVLEFSGVNGFTLPENVQLFGESPWILGDGVGGWRGSTDYTYDAAGSGHLYVTNHYEVKRTDSDAEMQFTMEVQKFLKAPEETNDYLQWAYTDTYDMWDIREWLGYSVADVNTRKPLSQQDQQKVSENFELLDNIYATQHGSIGTGHWEKEDEQVYLRKSDILTEGSIRMTFTLDSLKTKTVTDKFTFTDPQTGEETPMTMELSPWGVSFSWKPSDPMPRVFGYVVPVSDKDILNGSCSGYVRTPDGLTRQIEKSQEELSNLFYHVGHVPYVYVDQAYAEGRVTLYMSFLEPVDPDQVQEVYAEDGTLMWKK